jgi:hypothetical protein
VSAAQKAEPEVVASRVRIRTSVALELAIRQGVEDSLDEYAAEYLREWSKEVIPADRWKVEITNRVCDSVMLSIATLLDFEEDEP